MTRIGFVRAAIAREPSFAFGLAASVVCIVMATAIRWFLGSAANGVPFVTYFPAIMVAALLAGWRWGLATVVASAVVANYLFLFPRFGLAPDIRSFFMSALFVLSCALIVAISETLRRTLRESQIAHDRAELLNEELRHRARNILALVNAIAEQTARGDPADFKKQFSGRLHALAKAQDILSLGNRETFDLAEIVMGACAPFQASGNFTFAGSACAIPGESCVPLTLALHELATNATKYGALSVPDGRVQIAWQVQSSDVLVDWREEGGPPVIPPQRRGFGTRLLKPQRGLSDIRLEFAPAGLQCRIAIADAKPLYGSPAT